MTGLTRRERERQARRAEIITAAEEVFSERGFDGATMDEIARIAQFTKRTVYQYFTGKEDLYFAVALKCVSDLYAYIQKGAEGAGTGIARMRLLSEAYYRFSKEYPDAFRLMNRASEIKADWRASGGFQGIAGAGQTVYRELAAIIIAGQKDGSIRSDLGATEGAFALLLLVTGFVYRLSLVGEAYAEVYGMSEDSLARLGIDILMWSIQAR